MTEYYRKLDAVAQSRYLEKLKLLGLEEKDDPYEASNSCNFIDDMTKWPSVEYGRIFCYYIQHPGVYTRRQLMQWKSLETFNYFESGHVRQIKVWPLSSCRKTVETEAFFLTNIVGAADNTTVINHLSLQVFKFPKTYNFVNLQCDSAAVFNSV